MKICICTQLKNDSDVVESYCRYQLTYADHLIITDDRSVDNTVDIINALIAEGLPITLIQVPHNIPVRTEPDLSFAQTMYDLAIIKMKMDWVLPLDADEFLFCSDGRNPREELEALSTDVEYRLFWRTSVYRQDPIDSTVFLPTYFDDYRDPLFEFFSKALLSRHLAIQKGARPARGKHSLEMHGVPVPVVKHGRLFIAHFPLRSIAHAIVKITNGWQKYQYYGTWDGTGIQWKYCYEYMAQHGTLEPEQLRTLSKEYALWGEQKNKPVQTIPQAFGALRLDFLAEPIRLRYTDYTNRNYIKPVLEYYELLIDNLLRCTIEENKQN
jgi:hypothetical protein